MLRFGQQVFAPVLLSTAERFGVAVRLSSLLGFTVEGLKFRV